MVNIIPFGDIVKHIEDGSCHCKPKIINEYGDDIIIHNSYDGREIIEDFVEDIVSGKPISIRLN